MTTNQMPKLTTPFNSTGLTEAMQAKQVRFAFVEPDPEGFTALMPMVLCRDYLKDMLYCRQITHAGIGSIYGMDTSKFPFMKIVTDATLLGVTAAGPLIDNITANLNKLWEYEDSVNAEPTEVIEASTEGAQTKALVLVGDKAWQDSLLGISLYSFLPRMLSWGQYPMDSSINDANLWKYAKILAKTKSLKKINQFGFLEKRFTVNNYTNLDAIHNYSGIGSMNPSYYDLMPEYKPFFKLSDG